MTKSTIFTVSSQEEGMGLLAFLREKLKGGPSVKSIKRAIDTKQCRVNGLIECISTITVKKGDKVEIAITEEKKSVVIDVLFEDDDLLICNKPFGVVSENEPFRKFFKKNGLELVHRLDKETSGVIILAKNKAVHEKMLKLFSQRKIVKAYLAIVDGIVKKSEGKIESELAIKTKYIGHSLWGSVSKGKGKIAITFWKCLKKGQKASLLLCEPKTGRTHQLRVHLSEMGHPILGDLRYGKTFVCTYQPTRHLLHAYRLIFSHPITQKEIEVVAPIPEDFTAAQKVLKMSS